MTSTTENKRIRAILDFWFGAPGSAEHGRNRAVWFQKSEDFDQQITNQFMADYQNARDGRYASWTETTDGCLALLILLDQFPRNMFRESARAFATDPMALEIAVNMVESGKDKTLSKEEKFFVYLPFEHAEDIEMQKRCLELTAAMPQGTGKNSPYYWAKKHYDVIARFGRFPHRNALLGRANSAEEDVYLSQPGAGF